MITICTAQPARDDQYGELEHFQKHWVKGEPVIVRGVLELTSGPSWEYLFRYHMFKNISPNTLNKKQSG